MFMTATQRTHGEESSRRLALSVVAALVMALGLCPVVAFAEDVEVEPEGGVDTELVVQSEDSMAEPEGQAVDEGESVVSVQDTETASNVSYLFYANEGDALNGKTTSGTHDCTQVESSATAVTWDTTSNEGWYVVEGEKTIEGQIRVSGDVHLILADGAKLTGHEGILLNLGKSLTIYAQSTDKDRMGALEITHPTEHGAYSAISGQNLTINGGMVTFTGCNTYGIYLCANGSNPIRDASLTINGGEVTAIGGIQVLSSLGDANHINASLTINGGTVIADGGKRYGLLAWDDGDNGRANATINGGNVTAFGENGAIGTSGGTLTIGDGVSVKVGDDEGSAVDIPAQDFQTNHTQKWAQTTVLVTDVTVTPSSATLTVGDTSTLTVTIEPEHAIDKSVTWTSSNTGVATVDEKTGEVTAGAAGTATITATANDGSGKSASCAVTVKAKPGPSPIPTPKPAKASKPATTPRPSKKRIVAKWKAVSGATSYELAWRVAGGKTWKTKTTTGTKLTVKGLRKGRLYQIRVRAVNGPAKGKWSKVSRCWLRGVSKVKAESGTSKGRIKVSWKKDKEANKGYKVYVYAKKCGKAVKAKKVSKSKTSVTIKGLKSGKRYYVRVVPLRAKSGKTYTGAFSGYRSVKAK